MFSNDRLSYVYKLVELSTGKWYIGSRTKKGCHPDDGYMGSSKIVTPKIKANPRDWEKIVISTGDISDMLAMETNLLKENNARDNPMSYNRHNGDGKFNNAGKSHSEETRRRMSKSNRGKPRPMSPEDQLKRIESVRAAVLGKKQSAEHRAKRSAAMSGKTQSDEHKAKRSAALKEYHKRRKSMINNSNGVFK